MEYHLESPLWEYVKIHLHKGEYQGISSMGKDHFFHVFVPYMFDEKELTEFLKDVLFRLKKLLSPEQKAIST